MVLVGDVDKTGWEMGEWTAEPDTLKWTDEATGLPCMITRHPHMGHLCGYVGVDMTHSWFEDHYREHHLVDVHGNITFSEHMPHEQPEIWWFGFDCGHGQRLGDKSPGPFPKEYELFGFRNYGIYRNIEFVKSEIVELARQVKEGEGTQWQN